MRFGEKVRRYRGLRQLSQGDLAALIGRPQGRVSKWELGEGYPRPAEVLKIAGALRLPLRFLCDDELDDPEQAPEAPPLTEATRKLWDLVELLGPARAIARLAAMPEPAPPPAQPQPPPALPGPAPEDAAPGPAKLLGKTKLTKRPAPDPKAGDGPNPGTPKAGPKKAGARDGPKAGPPKTPKAPKRASGPKKKPGAPG